MSATNSDSNDESIEAIESIPSSSSRKDNSNKDINVSARNSDSNGNRNMCTTDSVCSEDIGTGLEGDTLSSKNEISKKGFARSHQTLATVIGSPNSDLEVVADDWFNILKTNPVHALNLIVDLLLESSGLKEHTTENDNEVAQLLISSLGYQKRLSVFFKYLMSPHVISEISVMKRLNSAVISMSESKWKSLRLTAIVVAIQLISSLLEADKLISSELISSDEDERTRKSEIEKEFDSQTIEKDYIHSHFDRLFREIIRVRSRDVEFEIRMYVLCSILEWIVNYPNKMAVDYYMKYINWFLCDIQTSIRLVAVKAIMKIVTKINDIRILYCFLKNNVPKLTVRINDVDSKVGEAAIKTLDHIDSCFKGLLSNMSYEQIYMNIYSVDRNKIHAAGRFLLRKLGDNNDEENCVIDLIEFQLESPIQDRGEFLISSIFKDLPFLTNWDNWINCLNNETDANRKVITCQLMLHTIRIAATGQMPPWPVNNLILYPIDEDNMELPKELLQTRVQIMSMNHQNRITEYFSNRLIELMQQNENDQKCLVYFFAIPQYFEYSDPQVIMPIIDELQCIALTSEDVKVTHNCLYHLSIIVNKMPEKQKAQYSFEQKSLQTKIVQEYFVPTVNKIVTSEETEVIDEEVKIILEKTAAFAKIYNLTDTPVSGLAIKGLQSSIQKQDVLGINIFANISYQNVVWKLKEILDYLKVSDNPLAEEVMKLKFLNHKLFACGIKILSLNLSDRLKSIAFLISCNLLTVFSIRNKKINKLKSAVIYPSNNQLEWLAHFLTTSVSESFEEGNISTLLRNKHLLSKYCTLLENNIIPTSNIANILPYFQSEAYNNILTKPLHALLCNAVTIQSTVTSIIYALEVLLERCQKRERISEQAKLQNILEGICTSLHPKYSGLEKAIQEIQIIGLECIYLVQNKPFFNILEFFVPLIRKTEHIFKLKDLVIEYFPHSTDKDVVKSYLTSLNQVTEALERGKYTEILATTLDEEELSVSCTSTRDGIWNISDNE